ncbi:hypothetical protein D0S45_10195 [Marinifilum sp. JC120]|nr:hypothetical protein D0S45_10195 [Marinifilum sp. JC120]
MSSRQLLDCCIATSILIHLCLIQFDWTPEPAMCGEMITLPIDFDIPAASSTDSMVLEQGATRNSDKNNAEERARRLERLAKKRYLKQIREAVEQRKFLTEKADLSGLIGNVQYFFHIRPDDTFSEIRLVRSSGSQHMDKAAGRAIAAASGVVKRPRILQGQSFTLKITVKYQRNM